MAPLAATFGTAAGRFNWFYEVEETIYVIEGGGAQRGIGVVRRLRAGDSYFFAAGAHVEWHVEDYIRKFALIGHLCRAAWCFAKRGYRFLGDVGGSGSANAAPAMIKKPAGGQAAATRLAANQAPWRIAAGVQNLAAAAPDEIQPRD
jgi:hypothetical protein